MVVNCLMNSFTAKLLSYVLRIVAVLGVTIVIWTIVVGTDGLDGQSVLKESIWEGVQATYSTLVVEKTDNYGYGYAQRTKLVWNNCSAVTIQDTQSPQTT